MITLALLVVAITLPLFLFWNYLRISWYVDKLPGIKKIPFIGTAYVIMGVKREDMFAFIVERNKKFAPIFRTWFMFQPVVHLVKAEQLETIMKSSVNISKGHTYDAVKPWLGDGLVTVNSREYWHRNRKLITPAFHFNILDNFLDVFNEKSLELVELLEPFAKGKSVNLQDYIINCTLDIICETSLGVEFGAMRKPSSYATALKLISSLGTDRLMKPWNSWDFIYKRTKDGKEFYKSIEIAHRVANEVLHERKKSFKMDEVDSLSEEDRLMGKKKRLAFLDLLIAASQDGKGLTDHEIRQEIDTILFAGHDTTSTGITWSLFLLGNHPEIQDKVRAEIEEILQGDDRHFTSQDLAQMKYLERVIKEAQRIYPNVPIIGRRLIEDVKIGKYLIPAGVSVALHIHDVHHDEETYPDPYKFDPDRFLPENTKGRHPYSFVPFSAGPRNCIGQKFAMMEQKVILATLLTRFRIRALQRPEDIKLLFQIVLKPKDGLPVVLQKIDRKSNHI